MTYEDFIATKVPMTRTMFDCVYATGVVSADKVLVYADGLFIEVLGRNKFTCTIDRSSYNTDNLTDLENKLFEYYLEEF